MPRPDPNAAPRTLAEIRRAYELDPADPVFTAIDARDCDDDTLLHRAAFRGDARDVRDLLAMGAAVNLHGDLGYTPLHYAAMQGHLAIVEHLLTAGANPAATDEDGRTAAFSAETFGHAKVLKAIKSAAKRR